MSPISTSTRWCPTPEQLMILEELYRRGIRTPSASQIQSITSHLSLHGRIEGKNVFYWFQNHKARDKQKFRRNLIKELQVQHEQEMGHHHRHSFSREYFLNCFDPPAASVTPFYSDCVSPAPGSLYQGVREEAPARGLRSYSWTVEIPQWTQMENPMRNKYGHDWRMMMNMDHSPSPPRCSNPLETLQLFPVTSTNLKEENNASPNQLMATVYI